MTDNVSTGSDSAFGRQMDLEMAQQPAVLAALGERLPELSQQIHDRVRGGVAGVAFLARGSSDNAALLGRYTVELHTGLPTCLVAPSLQSAYGSRPSGFAGWLVVAVSQSGQTPEIVNLASTFADVGAIVIGITNDERSELAAQADIAITLGAGDELAVPATKTVTAQMMAMMAIAGGLSGGSIPDFHANQVSDAVAQILADTASVETAAIRLSQVDRLAVVGRGLVFPAARETALKLQETTGVMAQGFSTADFRHGPIAVCGPGAPAVLLTGNGPADQDTRELIGILDTRRAESILIGPAGTGARIIIPTLDGAADCLLSTVRGQQLALALCRARGIEPDHPLGLSKVTLTH